jgi:hypothetical protein
MIHELYERCINTVYKFAVIVLVMSMQVSAAAETSFWSSSVTPATQQVTSDTSPVTLGIRFYSTQPGTVTAVRFYKGWQNTGTHIGTLWSNTGTKLASVTFSGETAVGWQRANFSTPVSIAANTTYVISYFAPKGAYAVQQQFQWSGLSSGSLRAGSYYAGVYEYGSYNTFPTRTYMSSNYYVDLVFVPSTTSTPTSPTPSTYTISGRVSGPPATVALSGPVTGAKVTDSTGAYSFSGLPNGIYVLSASQPGYTFSPSTAQVTINGASATAATFTATTAPITTTKSISLSWTRSTSTNVVGYNVYRADVAGGTYVKRNSALVTATTYVDSATSGRTYYYVATAVDSNKLESGYSNQSVAVVQ